MFQQRFRKLREFVSRVGGLSTFVFPVRLSRILSDYANLFYSGRIKKDFMKCGTHFYVKRPLTVYNPKNIFIGNDVYIYNNAILATHMPDSRLEIGNGVMIGESCHISCSSKVHIEDNVLLGRRVHITDNSHGETTYDSLNTPPLDRSIYSKGEVIIRKNVWIGDNVVILAGVEIGECSVVGAQSVVTKSVPAFSICAGVPAKVIKHIERDKQNEE